MYVAVKGGEKAIAEAHRLLAEDRRGDPDVAEIGTDQIASQLRSEFGQVDGVEGLLDDVLSRAGR